TIFPGLGTEHRGNPVNVRFGKGKCHTSTLDARERQPHRLARKIGAYGRKNNELQAGSGALERGGSPVGAVCRLVRMRRHKLLIRLDGAHVVRVQALWTVLQLKIHDLTGPQGLESTFGVDG